MITNIQTQEMTPDQSQGLNEPIRLIIIGHGPSVLSHYYGEMIDGMDVVVRLKRCRHLLASPEHFGTKTDVVAGSWGISPELRGIGGAKKYWVLFDSRNEVVPKHALDACRWYFDPYEVLLDQEFCDKWDKVYREIRDEMGIVGHNHMSQGSKAIIMACEFINPDEIHLIGFDNVTVGEFTWSITRGPNWTKYPDHCWNVERVLIDRVADHYNQIIYSHMPNGEALRFGTNFKVQTNA